MNHKPSHEIIGEGTYGCVVKPSLQCKPGEPQPNTYDNSISKIMTNRHAKKEVEDFEKVLNIPNIEEHFIPKPHICKPNEDETYKALISKCKNKLIKEPIADPRILIMEDGGVTMDTMMEIIPSMSVNEFKRFICAWRNLIDSICFLWKHKIMHHDLKCANVVYQMKTGKIRLIDFGKVKTMETFIHKSKSNQNLEGVTWFNYPTENHCTNIVHFEKEPHCQSINANMSYDIFIVKAAMTFDTYGLGLVFQEILNTIRGYYEMRENVSVNMYMGIHWNFFEELEKIAMDMCEDVITRENKPHIFLERFVKLCIRYKVECRRSNKLSVNMQKRLENMPHIVSKNIFNIDKKEVCKKIGKRLNPYTQKCVPKCKKEKNMVRLNQPPTKTRKKGVFKCVKKR